MTRYDKIVLLAKEKNIPTKKVLLMYLTPLHIRTQVCDKFNRSEDDNLKPDDLYQLCDTPPSQARLVQYF